MPAWLHIAIIAVLGLCLIYYNRLPEKHLGFIIIILTACAYPLGSFYRDHMIGPRWVRWYLGDAGFVQAVTVAWSIINSRFQMLTPETVNHFSRLVYMLALGYEVMQAYPKAGFFGTLKHLDYIDCLMYTLGFAIVQLSLKYGVKRSETAS